MFVVVVWGFVLGVCLVIGLVGFAVFDFGLLIVLCIIPLRFHCLLGFGLCV